MNAFDATVSAYAEVGRDLWTDVKDCASLGLAFVSPEEVCLALPSERLGELCFPPVGMPDLPERCLFVWWAAGEPRELARLARQFSRREMCIRDSVYTAPASGFYTVKVVHDKGSTLEAAECQAEFSGVASGVVKPEVREEMSAAGLSTSDVLKLTRCV